MVDWDSTREERMDRLRGLVEGSSASKRVQHAGPGNFLMGVALHAAARADRAMELSDIERLLVEALDQLLPADEIAEAGQIFTQAQARGATSLFPSKVAAMSVDTSYTGADLLADLPALGAQVLTQPNCSVVDVADLDAGGEIDSPEFLEAMKEYGAGLTVITGESKEPSASATPVRFGVKLKWFKCVSDTGDSFFGPRDEIYWMTGAGADSHHQTTYASPEFGSIVSGSERTFPGNAMLFRGDVTGIMTADIECWEKDRGDFWNSIRDALADVANYCADACVSIKDNADPQEGDEAAALAALIAVIAGLMGALLDWLLGKDDLIQQRNIAFKRAYLERLRTSEDWFSFIGEGAYYKLYLKVGAPKKISSGWPGLGGTNFVTDITGTNVPGNNADVFLFKGDQALRYDTRADRITWGPKKISHSWTGLGNTDFAAGVDAGTLKPGSSSEVFLFRGANYVRYYIPDEKIMSGPRTISGGWPGLQGTGFAAGNFDAATARPGSSSDVYLFKGDQYVRYNVSTEKIAAGPRKISDGWPGLRDTIFAVGGFSGATVVPGSSSDVYIFKGDQYVRYNTSVESIVS
ncbi:hemopexin repeat-containing protein [Nocardia sp. NPDC050408]|uniref:hemopexin repeat-containing protein n=1 Tax=Nocardia sp. NPDC050408 TaxID=3364319 RepID=UPI0037AF35C4